MSGKFYIVATPLGNLSDMTYRAVNVLKEVDFVLAEDTRVSQTLLDHYAVSKPLIRYDQHSFRNEAKKLEILNYLLQGKSLALVTDAGTPGISDPGNELIGWINEVNPEIEIIPIPGPSSVTTALSVCGFDVSSFVFLGFLPKKKKNKLLENVSSTRLSIVFFESPFRIVKTLEELVEVFGEDRRIFVGRELTKMHEEHLRGSIKQVLADLKERSAIKGEIVAVIE